MKVQISTLNNYNILSVEGRLDAITSGDFENSLLKTIEKDSSNIVIDCKELEYISSSGLRVFLIGQKKLGNKGGGLRICNLQPAIKEIFDISGFSSIFSIHTDLETATKS